MDLSIKWGWDHLPCIDLRARLDLLLRSLVSPRPQDNERGWCSNRTGRTALKFWKGTVSLPWESIPSHSAPAGVAACPWLLHPFENSHNNDGGCLCSPCSMSDLGLLRVRGGEGGGGGKTPRISRMQQSKEINSERCSEREFRA